MKYICVNCGFIFDEDINNEEYGIKPGTKFEDMDADWKCPICYADKDKFDLVD